MGNVEAFEPEHALAPAGELPARRGTHAADPDDDHVIAVALPCLLPRFTAALWTMQRGGWSSDALSSGSALARQSLMRPGRGAGAVSSAGRAKKNSA